MDNENSLVKKYCFAILDLHGCFDGVGLEYYQFHYFFIFLFYCLETGFEHVGRPVFSGPFKFVWAYVGKVRSKF